MSEIVVPVVGEQPPPEPPKGRYVRILVASQKTPAILVVGHRNAIGRYVHWVRRGLLCATPGEVCECKYKPYPRRWYAYMVGWDAKDMKRAVLQIPWHSWRSNQWLQNADNPDHLIGHEILVTRTGANPRCPVAISKINSWKKHKCVNLTASDATQWLEWAYDHVSPEFMSEGELQ